MIRLFLLVLLALGLSPPALAQPDLTQRTASSLATASPGTRFGLLIVDNEGRELVAISPDMRFLPASNTKLVISAAAFANRRRLEAAPAGVSVRLERAAGGGSNVVLTGYGEARLSSGTDCTATCLATLADAISARTRRVNDVIGDARWFPDERWSAGMSWNNIPTRSGTAISALSLDDNEILINVRPSQAGRPARIDNSGWFTIRSEARTAGAGSAADLNVARLPGSRELRITGSVPPDGDPVVLRLGLDDPALYAAWRLRVLLEARGVRVSGQTRSLYRTSTEPAPGPLPQDSALSLPMSPFAPGIAVINKPSQNLYSELMLRRLGRLEGDGSVESGVVVVRRMFDEAGVDRRFYDFSDGSGMSTYNRLSPRAAVTLLRWIARQPWGPEWRGTLAVAGTDGTLANRFRGTSLAGRLFAKTGTLNATNALSGYLIAASGRVLTFSAFANDVPGGGGANGAIDAALIAVAANY